MHVPDNFLGLPDPHGTEEQARVVILPVPYEATVSYGSGTEYGPRAIISASQQVELYDREYDAEPALAYGVYTAAPLVLPAEPPQVMETIAAAVENYTRRDKLVVVLGGEHSLSLGVGRGLVRALGGPLTVVQIDAHCDLRDQYDDTPYSHACVARRLLEEPGIEQVLQLGIRSLCTEEAQFARQNPDRVRIWFAEDVHAGSWQAEFQARLRGRRVFLTLDVDGLDPAVVPATGTPEPDGLSWTETLEILRLTANTGTVVGMDCVELAPVSYLHAADFAVAKLVYKAISYAVRFGKQGA
ncbi:MAG: agmatinase [Chloroflexi bacterium]|nr:MAG: agmatinase [Chloroflexota bacterium]